MAKKSSDARALISARRSAFIHRVKWGSVKSVVIVALAVSALLLGMQSRIFSDLFASISSGGQTTTSVNQPSKGVTAEAARPTMIVATNDDGARVCALHDDIAIDALYEITGSILGEALATAQSYERCDERQWRDALKSAGVLFEYAVPVRLDVLRGWLGADEHFEDASITLRRLCLSFEEGALYFEGGGVYFRAAAGSLGGARPTIPVNFSQGLRYAFERDADSPAPYMLLVSDARCPVASVTNPLEDEANVKAALIGLGIPSSLESSYPTADGTRVFVTNNVTVSVTRSGEITYHLNTPSTALGEVSSLREAVEYTRRVGESVGMLAGDARLYFSGAEDKSGDLQAENSDESSGGELGVSSGNFTVTFDYFLTGGRIYLPSGSAVTVEFEGGVAVRMTFEFRRYVKTGEPRALLPPLQAIAASGGEAAVGYADTGMGAISPFWYKVVGE
jgi:hypothetical protein